MCVEIEVDAIARRDDKPPKKEPYSGETCSDQ